MAAKLLGTTELSGRRGAYDMLQDDIRSEQRWRLNMTALPKELKNLPRESLSRG
ncbi:MAG: hypothetical protein MUO80_01010 [Dehalococcoidia bacterium]|nr:hypothetical protein [Dehalococcoidia bacterium]